MKNNNEVNNNGANGCSGANMCSGANRCDGANRCSGANGCSGANWCDGANRCYGANRCSGVNRCSGANRCYGANECDGANWCDGANECFGVFNCYGVDRALFLANKPRTCSIFGKEVTEDRFDEVMGNFRSLLNGWYPKFNNAFELYEQNGFDWSKVDASKIISTLPDYSKPYEAWKDMPKEAIEYIRSLPEFDAEMFKVITGIDVEIK